MKRTATGLQRTSESACRVAMLILSVVLAGAGTAAAQNNTQLGTAALGSVTSGTFRRIDV